MISWSSLNLGHVWLKTRSLGRNSFLQSSWNFTRMFDVMISRSVLNMGPVGLKTRSLCQISLKPNSSSRGHGFALIFKELYQNICLDDILVK